MRLTPAALSLALVLVTVSSAVSGQATPVEVDPRSIALVERGDAAKGAGNLAEANGYYETALAVDPRNRRAFVALGDAARAQNLPGKAIRFYRDALRLDANDTLALAGEGEALVQRGAVDRARTNLARVRTLCSAACAEGTRLASAIERGPPPAVVSAQASATVPTPGAEGRTRTPQN